MIKKHIALIIALVGVLCNIQTTTANQRTECLKKIILATQKFLTSQDKKEPSDSINLQQLIALPQDNPSKESVEAARIILDTGNKLYNQREYHQVISLFSQISDPLQEILPDTDSAQSLLIDMLNQLGMSYKMVGLQNSSLNSFLKALVIAEHHNLSDKKAILYNNIGSTYQQQKEYGKADSVYLAACRINEAAKDTEKLFVNYNNLSVTASRAGNFPKALEYAFLAVHQLDPSSDSIEIAWMKRNIAGIYLSQNEKSLAEKYLKEVLDFQERNRLERDLIDTYIILSKLYSDNPDSAQKYLEKALKIAEQHKQLMYYPQIVEQLGQYYEQKQDYRQTIRLLKKNITIKDSLLKNKTNNQHQTLQAMYLDEKRMMEEKEELIRQQNRIQRDTRLYIALTSVFCLFILTGSILYIRRWKFKYYRKIKKRIQENERKYQSQTELYNQLQDEFEQEKALVEAAERKKTVTSVLLMRNQECFISLRETLQQINLNLNIRDTSNRKLIKEALTYIDQIQNENAQKEFVDSFENINQDFYNRLSQAYPGLTSRELRLCALIRLGLSNKEIADITFREVRSVEAARNRLRKKFALPQREDLLLFLKQFD